MLNYFFKVRYECTVLLTQLVRSPGLCLPNYKLKGYRLQTTSTVRCQSFNNTLLNILDSSTSLRIWYHSSLYMHVYHTGCTNTGPFWIHTTNYVCIIMYTALTSHIWWSHLQQYVDKSSHWKAVPAGSALPSLFPNTVVSLSLLTPSSVQIENYTSYSSNSIFYLQETQVGTASNQFGTTKVYL